MFTKTLLALSAASMIALPAAAEARHRNYSGYNNSAYYGGGYDNRYYGNGYDGRYYGRRGYDNRYYGRHYRHNRCGNGTTGAIVGGAAGALIGREVTRSNRGYYGNRNSGTTGAIIGGALGALVGREVARGC
jgi:hypothetical protein